MELLDWCSSLVGPCEIVSGDPRYHGRTSVCRLRTSSARFYLKIHAQKSVWETEAHGYARWAPAFGVFAPRLIGTHDEEPFALLVSELSGRSMERASLSDEQTLRVWEQAGSALVRLHEFDAGEVFGVCGRDGTGVGAPVSDAVEHISSEFERYLETGIRAGFLSDEEVAVVRDARTRIPAFAGERPIPCHRDYGPANWLVTDEGEWAGVIDFEFSYWDVRASDFSRYPGWEWIRQPELLDAFFAGYGRHWTAAEESQILCSRALYALGAIVWGCENSFFGFAAEGRAALKFLSGLLP